MKKNLIVLIVVFLTLISCRKDDSEFQEIDQILNLFIKDSSGKDLLNTKLEGAYNNVTFLDLLAETDLKPISGFSIRKNADTINYIDYTAGAIRILQDSINQDHKVYSSSFVMRLSKVVDSMNVIDDDTIKIEYNWTPLRFELSKLYYNNQLKFTKVAGQPNIVTIVK